MSIPESDTRAKPETAQKLVRVEVEVPEGTVESVLAYAASMRGKALSDAKDFKAFLTCGPAWTDEFVELVNERDKRPPRDIDL